MLVVCTESVLDRYTSNWTIVNIVEQFQFNQYPTLTSLQIILFLEFEDDELNQEFDVRVVLRNVAKEKEEFSRSITVESKGKRHRIRQSGMPFNAPGYYRLEVDWRRTGDPGWVRDPISYPIQAEILESKPDEQEAH